MASWNESTSNNREGGIHLAPCSGDGKTICRSAIASDTVEVPDLSARTEDIPLLVDHFLKSMSYRELRVSPDAIGMLQRYPWPGNVRELRSAVERAATLADGTELEPVHFSTEIRGYASGSVCIEAPDVKPLAKSITIYEKGVLSKALESTGGNMSRTAKLQGISRSTLYEKCRSHGI